jgi:hypothetical protein
MLITDIAQLDPKADYTYADYLLWQFKERVELFRGKLRQMAAPSVKHQRLSSILSHRITSEKTNTVVQPDLCVVCDRNKLDERGCIGAPELVVEILALGNSKKEIKEKYELYESAGVSEYWVIDPEHFVVYSYRLNKESQQFVASRPLTDEDALTSAVLEGFSLDLSRIFTNE